jgi:hypothetical protein
LKRCEPTPPRSPLHWACRPTPDRVCLALQIGGNPAPHLGSQPVPRSRLAAERPLIKKERVGIIQDTRAALSQYPADFVGIRRLFEELRGRGMSGYHAVRR